MTAKEYLKRNYRLNELIESDREEIENLRELATSITAGGLDHDRVNTGNSQKSKIEENVIKIVALEEKINEEINEFLEIREAVRDMIAGLKDRNEQLILRYRYIEFLPWSTIAFRTGFTEPAFTKPIGKPSNIWKNKAKYSQV